MNIKAIWKDPDSLYRVEKVTIINIDRLDGVATALVVDKSGHMKYLRLSELEVIDDKYLPKWF